MLNIDFSVHEHDLLLPKETLMKPSNTIKLDQVEIPDHASIQASIIPCVTDIETGQTSTKGYFIFQLMGRALHKFSQNHKMKFQISIAVADKNAGSEIASGSTPDNRTSFEKTVSFTVRNKKGQLKCLIDLISHEDLLQICSSEISVGITYCISCQGS